MAFGSTMRLGSLIFACMQVFCAKERSEPYADSRQRVASTLLSVDHTDGCPTFQTSLTERFDRLDRGSAGGDHVLDQADALACREDALEAVGRPVVLRLLTDDQEREPRRKRGRGGKRDRPELGPGQAIGFRLVLCDCVCEPFAQGAEQIRARLEAVLVQVVAGALPGAEQEVALQVRVLLERAAELAVVQLVPAEPSASRACWSRRSALADPSVTETIVPSAK